MQPIPEVSDEELRRICGRYQKKYGMAMDTLTASLLNEMQEKGQHSVQVQAEALEEIRSELKAMKSAIKPFATADPRIAFAYGLGRHAWAWTGMFMLGLGVVLEHVRVTTTTEYMKAQEIVQRYPDLYRLEPLIKSARIIERKQGVFLELSPAREQLQLGRNYLVSPNAPMPTEATNILVPLRFH